MVSVYAVLKSVLQHDSLKPANPRVVGAGATPTGNKAASVKQPENVIFLMTVLAG